MKLFGCSICWNKECSCTQEEIDKHYNSLQWTFRYVDVKYVPKTWENIPIKKMTVGGRDYNSAVENFNSNLSVSPTDVIILDHKVTNV